MIAFFIIFNFTYSSNISLFTWLFTISKKNLFAKFSTIFEKSPTNRVGDLQALKLIKMRVKILFSIISSQISLDSSLDLSPDNLFHD